MLGSSMGLPEAAETIHRLTTKWNVRHDKISFDKLGIGRNFPNHLPVGESRWRSPTPGRAGHKTNLIRQPAHRSRLEAAQSAGCDPPGLQRPPRAPPVGPPPQHPAVGPAHSDRATAAFPLLPGEYYVRLVDELRPLTYGLVGRKTKLKPKDAWATILGHSPDVADALIQSMILA